MKIKTAFSSNCTWPNFDNQDYMYLQKRRQTDSDTDADTNTRTRTQTYASGLSICLSNGLSLSFSLFVFVCDKQHFDNQDYICQARRCDETCKIKTTFSASCTCPNFDNQDYMYLATRCTLQHQTMRFITFEAGHLCGPAKTIIFISV